MAELEQPSGTGGGERVVIKKYANRRLYNTRSSSYITLEHLAKRGVGNVMRQAVHMGVAPAVIARRAPAKAPGP